MGQKQSKKREEISLSSSKNSEEKNNNLPVDQYYILPKFFGYKSVNIIDTKTQKNWKGLVVLEITLPNSPCTIYFDPNNNDIEKINHKKLTIQPGIKYLTTKAKVMGLYPLVPIQESLPFLINFALGHIGIVSHYDSQFIYELQKIVFPDQHKKKYNMKKIQEDETKIQEGCGHGIHFFMDPKSAINYKYDYDLLSLSQIFISNMITNHSNISKFTLDVYKSKQIGKDVPKEIMDIVNEIPYYYEDEKNPEQMKFSEYAEYERKFGKDFTTYTIDIDKGTKKLPFDEMKRIRNIQNEFLNLKKQEYLPEKQNDISNENETLQLFTSLCQTLSTDLPTTIEEEEENLLLESSTLLRKRKPRNVQ